MKRGIIAQPGVIKRLPNGFKLERNISKQEVAYYLLYWDRVVIPGNNLVYIGIPNEDDPSVKGILDRPRVHFTGSYSGDMITDSILSCQSIVANELMKDFSTDWNIHQFGSEFVLPPNASERRNFLKATLISMLPVPVENVEYNEILEFKEVRHDELNQMHDYLDSLYLEILKSPDEDLAAKKIVSELAILAGDLNKVTEERFKRTKKYDFSIGFNISGKDLMTGIASGAVFDFFATGITIPVGTIAGAVAPFIKIEAKSSDTLECASGKKHLGYLSTAYEHGLLDQ